MVEIDVELNVLSDDGGALALCLMAASFAIISANIECFDIILATHFILFDDGHIIIDPDMNQINESFNLSEKIDDTKTELDKIKKSNCVEGTIAIAPSLGQVFFFMRCLNR